MSPRPRGHSPGPPNAQTRPRALGAAARRRLRPRDAGGRAGETTREEEPGWRGPRGAGGRNRSPNSRGAGAERRWCLRARPSAVHGAATCALVRQGAAQATAALLSALQKLANARQTAAEARRELSSAGDQPKPWGEGSGRENCEREGSIGEGRRKDKVLREKTRGEEWRGREGRSQAIRISLPGSRFSRTRITTALACRVFAASRLQQSGALLSPSCPLPQAFFSIHFFFIPPCHIHGSDPTNHPPPLLALPAPDALPPCTEF